MLPIKLLPSFTVYSPLVLFTAMIYADQVIKPPESISGQVWLVSVVIAAMGLTRIVMWVRGGGREDSKGSSREIYKMIAANSALLEKVMDVLDRVVESQKQIAEAQSKSLDLYAKVSENIAVFRTQLENHIDLAKSGLDDVKDLIRDIKRD